MTAAGLKPGGRTRVRRSELPELIQFLKTRHLKACVGWKALDLVPTPGRNGYSEWAQWSRPSPDKDDQCYVYISRDGAWSEELRCADEAGDDERFGVLLGYPSCCARAFAQLNAKQDFAGARIDPVLALVSDESFLPWPTNVSLLADDWTLLSHVPCSASCEASRDTALSYLGALYELNPAQAANLSRRLSGHVLHTADIGVVRFTGRRSEDGIAVESADYGGSFLHALLREKPTIARKDGFIQIGGTLIHESRCRVYEFS